MSKPIINGLATYGIIRLYNAGKPLLAFFFTLLFTIGPVGMLFWAVVMYSFVMHTALKFVLLAVAFYVGFMAVGMTVGNATQNNAKGWMASIMYTIVVVGITLHHYSI